MLTECYNLSHCEAQSKESLVILGQRSKGGKKRNVRRLMKTDIKDFMY